MPLAWWFLSMVSVRSADVELFAGSAGWALRFDGHDDYARLAEDLPSGPMTIEMWIQPLQITDASGRTVVKYNKKGVILSRRSSNGNILFELGYNGERLYWQSSSADEVIVSGIRPSSSEIQGTVFHYAYAQNYNNFTIYINGEIQVQGDLTPLDGQRLHQDSWVFHWILGQRNKYSGGHWKRSDRGYGGVIDELRWWSVVRTQEQIRRHMMIPVAPNSSGLARKWSFDEGTGAGDGVTIEFGNGNPAKSPTWVVSPVKSFGGPVALSLRVGSAPASVLLCALLTPPQPGATVTAEFKDEPRLGKTSPAAGESFIMLDVTREHPPSSSMFCTNTSFHAYIPGSERIRFSVTAVLLDGGILSTSNVLDVQVTPNTAPVAGVARALETDGKAGYASVGMWPSPDSFSVGMWILPYEVIPQFFFSRHTRTGLNVLLLGLIGDGYQFEMFCTSRIGCDGGGGAAKRNYPLSRDDDWLKFETGKTAAEISLERDLPHHIMVTLHCYARGDGDAVTPRARLTMYLDGHRIGEDDNFPSCGYKSEHPHVKDPAVQIAPWEIGEEYDSGTMDSHLPGMSVTPSDHFHGVIDDFLFWSRELAADEVLEVSRGRHLAKADVIAHMSFDSDDPHECAERVLWDKSATCYDINDEAYSIVPPSDFPWTNALLGGARHVASPFPLVVGSPIHVTMQEGTCMNVTLRGADADGDALIFKSYDVLPNSMSLYGELLEFCAPMGQQEKSMMFDACDPFGACASATSAPGSAIFHVLRAGPTIIAFQHLWEVGHLRLVFDQPTNCIKLRNPREKDDSALAIDRVVQISPPTNIWLGRWELGCKALRLVLPSATAWSPQRPNNVIVKVLKSAKVRDAAETSFPSVSVSPPLEDFSCPGGEVLLPGEEHCQACPPGTSPIGDLVEWVFNNVTCVSCSASSYAPAGARSCQFCPIGEIPNSDQSGCQAVRCALLHKPIESGGKLCEIDLVLVAVLAAGIFVGILLLFFAYARWMSVKRGRVVKRALEKMGNQHKIAESLKAISTLEFPMVVIKANVFLDMERLVPYEEARDKNCLQYLDSVHGINQFLAQQQIIFFSHQWLSYTLPDPNNTHYNCMVRALQDITMKLRWSIARVYVWVDYTSIPQEVRYTQRGAIMSLPIYASMATAFVIVAPDAKHLDLNVECSLQTYSKRTWCRLECLSHCSQRGIEDMYMSTEASVAQVDENLLKEVLLIFEGDCACCRLKHQNMPNCDKELLVTPVLALYTSVVSDKDGSAVSRQVYDLIEAQKDRMFPKTFTAEFTSSRFSTVDFEKEEVVGIQERPLFGSLLDDLFDYQDNRMFGSLLPSKRVISGSIHSSESPSQSLRSLRIPSKIERFQVPPSHGMEEYETLEFHDEQETYDLTMCV